MFMRKLLSRGWKKPRRSLHAGLALLQAGNVEDAAVNPVVEDLVKQTAQVREQQTKTSGLPMYLPNAQHFVFEGAERMDDVIVFREYSGPRHRWHDGVTCCAVDVAMQPVPLSCNAHLDRTFCHQMQVVKQTYSEELDGILRFTAKFGHLYVLHSSPWQSLRVKDFNKALGRHSYHHSKGIRTSFMPSMTSSEHALSILLKDGFEETDVRETVILTVLLGSASNRFDVHFDEQLKFQNLQWGDTHFLNMDIRRKNAPDIRLAIRSQDKEFEKEHIGYPAQLFTQDHLVSWNAQHDPVVDVTITEKVSAIRRKIVTSYKLPPDRVTSKLGQVMEVQLITTTFYDKLLVDGTFSERNQENEVYICIKGKKQLYQVSEQKNFLDKLFQFCDKFK